MFKVNITNEIRPQNENIIRYTSNLIRKIYELFVLELGGFSPYRFMYIALQEGWFIELERWGDHSYIFVALAAKRMSDHDNMHRWVHLHELVSMNFSDLSVSVCNRFFMVNSPMNYCGMISSAISVPLWENMHMGAQHWRNEDVGHVTHLQPAKRPHETNLLFVTLLANKYTPITQMAQTHANFIYRTVFPKSLLLIFTIINV